MAYLLVLISCLTVFLFSNTVLSQNRSKELKGTVSLYFEGSIYRNSRGGDLQNGCEGWQTLHSSGESIFASRCDVERLDRLGLFAKSATMINAEEADARKIQGRNQHLMIDFTTSKLQALHGLTSDGIEVYIILDQNKKKLYYRAVGKMSALQNMGFNVSGLLKANDAMDTERKLTIDTERINVIEESGRKFLIGKTKNGKFAALDIDGSGKVRSYINLN